MNRMSLPIAQHLYGNLKKRKFNLLGKILRKNRQDERKEVLLGFVGFFFFTSLHK